MRIPFTDPLPAPRIIPAAATSAAGAVDALARFLAPSALTSAAASPTRGDGGGETSGTLVLTGAGISVASGLADYRGTRGTYTLNKTYRPIYYGEFVARHDARKRYWARSFLGSANLETARPNAAHRAVGKLGALGIVKRVITQSRTEIPIL